jgi:hypothetical protein
MKTRTTDMAEKTLWWIGAIGVVLVGIWLTAMNSAKSQPVNFCGTRADIERHLVETFGERQSGWGVGANGALFELWTSADGQTWTLVVSNAAGQACLLATGRRWQAIGEGKGA